MCSISIVDLTLADQVRSALCMTNPREIASIMVVSNTTNAMNGIHRSLVLYSVSK